MSPFADVQTLHWNKEKIKMLYKNAQIHNAAELEIDKADGSMTWYRMPKHLMGKFSLLSADEVHPSIYGADGIAKSLTKIIKKEQGL